MRQHDDPEWAAYPRRYAAGEWRGPIFRDMVLADVHRLAAERPESLSILDIGCGNGFDGELELQQAVARAAGPYIGIEPDPDIALSDVFTTVHRCFFEDAPLDPASIDIAFAVMVLEHIREPQRFWDKLYEVLRPGGVFWGFTVDARHWFVPASWLAGRLHLTDRYLDLLSGGTLDGRYENYEVFYRMNTPATIEGGTRAFTSKTFVNFRRVGQMDPYIPRGFRWLGRGFDRVARGMGWPGAITAVRLVK